MMNSTATDAFLEYTSFHQLCVRLAFSDSCDEYYITIRLETVPFLRDPCNLLIDDRNIEVFSVIVQTENAGFGIFCFSELCTPVTISGGNLSLQFLTLINKGVLP